MSPSYFSISPIAPALLGFNFNIFFHPLFFILANQFPRRIFCWRFATSNFAVPCTTLSDCATQAAIQFIFKMNNFHRPAVGTFSKILFKFYSHNVVPAFELVTTYLVSFSLRIFYSNDSHFSLMCNSIL